LHGALAGAVFRVPIATLIQPEPVAIMPADRKLVGRQYLEDGLSTVQSIISSGDRCKYQTAASRSNSGVPAIAVKIFQAPSFSGRSACQ